MKEVGAQLKRQAEDIAGAADRAVYQARSQMETISEGLAVNTKQMADKQVEAGTRARAVLDELSAALRRQAQKVSEMAGTVGAEALGKVESIGLVFRTQSEYMAADADRTSGIIEARIQEVDAVLQLHGETLNATSATAVDTVRRKAEEIATMMGEQIRILANTAETTSTTAFEKSREIQQAFRANSEDSVTYSREATEQILVRLEDVGVSLRTQTNELGTMSEQVTADGQVEKNRRDHGRRSRETGGDRSGQRDPDRCQGRNSHRRDPTPDRRIRGGIGKSGGSGRGAGQTIE